MALPTLVCGIVSFIVLFLLFKKSLKQPIDAEIHEEVKLEKPIIVTNLLLLLLCIVCLSISSFIGFEMWIIAIVFFAVQILFNLIYNLVRKKDCRYLLTSFKSAPWNFVPFLLSMFVIIMCLQFQGVTKFIFKGLSQGNSVFVYGIFSFLFSNIVNNIPMTTLFVSILSNGTLNLPAVYATIIGSNLGAMLTPIGALAGIMFLNILKEKDVKLTTLQFIKYGAIISIISLVIALCLLFFVTG